MTIFIDPSNVFLPGSDHAWELPCVQTQGTITLTVTGDILVAGFTVLGMSPRNLERYAVLRVLRAVSAALDLLVDPTQDRA